MPAKKRWIASVVAEAKKPQPALPFSRAAKQAKAAKARIKAA